MPVSRFTARVSGLLAANVTARLSEHPATDASQRVAGTAGRWTFLLGLEGGEAGNLLLEGDAQSEADQLAFDGDERVTAASNTKRVSF